MPWRTAALLTACLLPALAQSAPSPDPARALVARAIQAEGGEERHSQSEALRFKARDAFFRTDSPSFACLVDVFTQKRAAKITIQLLNTGPGLSLTVGYDGVSGWRKLNDQVEDLDEDTIADLKEGQYTSEVSSLRPLLKDRSYHLTALGESRFEGRPVDGVRVTSEGRPDVRLYFDRATGQNVKMDYRKRDRDLGKDVMVTEVFSDFREVDPAAPDEKALKAANLSTDGPALLEFLRRQTLPDADRVRLEDQVRRLGDPSFAVREKASAALSAGGTAAVPLLRHALEDPDREVVRRARLCLEQIEKASAPELPAAAVRLVGLRKPEGAAAVLLAYLPSAPDEATAAEVKAALAALVAGDSRPDPAVLRALDDRNPLRRAAAAEALGRSKPAPVSRRLLMTGIVQPRKLVVYHDGQKYLEREITELDYYNFLDESVFARPGK